jgi:dCTP deaminase
MSILPDTEIIELCLHSNGRAPLIAPFDAERVQPASYDMTLGNEFIIFDLIPFQVIDLANPPKVVGSKVNVADDEYITLMPGKFILGVTQEWLDCPINIAAKLDGKSSLARFGLLIHVTGGFVDPGFRGPLTLEILNVFPVPILLRPKLPFCQVGFQYLQSPASRPYAGRYQDARGVEASKYQGAR